MRTRTLLAMCAIAWALACGRQAVQPSPPPASGNTPVPLVASMTIARAEQRGTGRAGAIHAYRHDDRWLETRRHEQSELAVRVPECSPSRILVWPQAWRWVRSTSWRPIPAGRSSRLSWSSPMAPIVWWGNPRIRAANREHLVLVVSGTSSGQLATSEYDGTYRLFGLAGDVTLRVSKPGYVSIDRRVTVTDDDVSDFAMTTVDPLRNVAGEYVATFTADPTCQPALPSDGRERRYNATITQNGPQFRVTFRDAEFVVSGGPGNGFTGRVAPNAIPFYIADGYYEAFPDVVEKLGTSRFFRSRVRGTWQRSGTISLLFSVAGSP